jgi:V8-like Glu-specific endopeptidase
MSTAAVTIAATVLSTVLATALAATPAAGASTPVVSEQSGAGLLARTGPEAPVVRRVPVRERRAAAELDPDEPTSAVAAPATPASRALPSGSVEAEDGPAIDVAPLEVGTPALGRRTAGPALRTSGSDGALWPYAATANPNRQVGRLVFDRLPGRKKQLGHCTATVVNSANKSTVVTAGHCVYDVRNRRFYTKIRFVPGTENGSAPYGVWPARLVGTTPAWASGGAYRDDIGVVVVKTLDQRRIADVVGAHGIAFNQPVNQWRTLLGYPVTDPRFPGWESSGYDLYYCQGTDVYHAAGSAGGQLEVPCRMTGGSSGGPWLTAADDSWMGTLQTVNSNGPADAMFAPYFDGPEAQLYGQLGSR